MTLSSIFAVCLLFPYVRDIATDKIRIRQNHGIEAFTDDSAVMFTFSVMLALGIGAGLLGAGHLYFLSTGQTTIEFYSNLQLSQRLKARGIKFRNPYDEGMYTNFEYIFGAGYVSK